jgi:hypothetical protein
MIRARHAISNRQRQASEGQVRRFMGSKRRQGADLGARFTQRSANLRLMFRGKRATRRDQGQNLFHHRPMPAP